MSENQKTSKFEYEHFLSLLEEKHVEYVVFDKTCEEEFLTQGDFIVEELEFDQIYPALPAYYPKRPIFLPPPELHYTNILDVLTIQNDRPIQAADGLSEEGSGRAFCPAEPVEFR